MSKRRNIVLVTGRSAVGKTTIANYLRVQLVSQGIPCEDNAISDALSLLNVLRNDDEQGGFHHTHEWCDCKEANKGHSHSNTQPILPFTVIDNTLPDAMLSDFFTQLSNIPASDKICIAEWAAGAKSVNSESTIDYSCRKIRKMFLDKELPSAWLDQVHSVIHLMATDTNRIAFNEKRNPFPSEDTLSGKASWHTQRKILEFYQEDDFAEVKDLFIENCIPIYEINNDGSDLSLITELDVLIHELSLLPVG